MPTIAICFLRIFIFSISLVVMASQYRHIRNYIAFLRQFKSPFPCSFCGMEILAQNYENHCTEEKHDIQVKRSCLWCKGKVSWPNRKKHLHMEHVTDCAKTFLRNILQKKPSSNMFKTTTKATTTTTASTTTITEKTFEYFYRKCRSKDFFGVLEKILQQRPDTMVLNFDIDDAFLFKIPDPPTKSMMENVLKFRDEDIDKAVYFTKYFLGKVHESSDAEIASDYIDLDHVENWYHLMVKRVCFDSFLEAMRQYDCGHTRILPFYTWCDGGNFEDFEYRQHIHMIVASRKEGKHFFEHVWPRVKPSSKPFPNFQGKEHKCIATPLHFINALRYVSSPHSSCNGKFNKDNNNNKKVLRKKISFMTPENYRHFYITIPLPEIAKFCLALQYDNGLVDLLQSTYQNFEPDYDLDGVVDISGRWFIPVRNLLLSNYNNEYNDHCLLDLVLPIHPDFILEEDTTTTTNAYVYYPSKKIYFKLRDTAGGEEEFKFMRTIENYHMPLRPRVQKRLHSIKQSMNRANRTKESEIEAIYRYVDSKERVWFELMKQMEAVRDDMEKIKSQLSHVMNNKTCSCQTQINFLIRKMDDWINKFDDRTVNINFYDCNDFNNTTNY